MSSGKVEQINKYGAWVWADVEGEKVRHDICLCFRCERLILEEDAADYPDGSPDDLQAAINKRHFNCQVAQKLYELCVETNIAAPVTRCPMFKAKESE